MKAFAVHGTLLNPISQKDVHYIADGSIIFAAETGRILMYGDRRECESQFPNTEKLYTDDDVIIVPGFVDLHVHLPQLRIMGTFSGTELLPWLQQYTWPEENKFKDQVYAHEVVGDFIRQLLAHGTTTAISYSSIHEHVIRMAFRSAENRLRLFIGNVLMDRNSPDYLLQKTDDAITLTNLLAKEFTTSYVLTPRFAPTCSMELMKACAGIRERWNCYIQTHLSENRGEMDWVRQLFPGCPTYTHVYREAGLLTPRTIMGHVIHVTDEELEILRDTGTKIAHCPTSNRNLLSGRMGAERFVHSGVRFALGTDVGAGDTLSLLKVMNAFFDEHKWVMKDFQPKDTLWWATLAGAEALGIEETAGNFAYGKDATFVIFKRPQETPKNPNTAIEVLWNTYKDSIQATAFRGRIVWNSSSGS